ncbi:uncharacterized protein Hap1MRO34_025878 isoform 2-T2 [Clarias gariepinus]
MAHNPETLPSDAGLVAELSVSFHEELSASIQSAFGVAGELAVAEVSKLVGKAFRDVRDQLHKTLLANRNLQARLSLTQTELRAARRRAPDTRDIAVGTSECFKRTHRDAVCQIGQDVKPDLTRGQDLLQIREGAGLSFNTPDLIVRDIKEDHHAVQEDASRAERACIGTALVPEASAAHIKGCMSFESGLTAKLEEADECAHPDTKSNTEQEIILDSLSVAQSKLLEVWRPEPLPLQSCQSNSYGSSGSSALANTSLFQEDLPGMDFLSSASSGQPDTCHIQLSQRDASSLTNPAPNSLFLSHTSGQGHASDQPFPTPEDVHRYRGLLQPKPASHQQRSTRRSLYPPGRSPFRCSQCGRDFNRLEHLKIHQRIHTGEKPYACSECTARFRHSWALTRHLRIHTGEKPYLCTQCGKSFRNCGGLRFHQRTHARQSGLTNNRPNLEDYGRT